MLNYFITKTWCILEILVKILLYHGNFILYLFHADKATKIIDTDKKSN